MILSSFQKTDFTAVKTLKERYDLQRVIQGYLFPHSDEAIQSWFEKISNPGASPSELHWAVRTQDRFSGYVALYNIDWINSNAEIGVVIESQGEGIGTEAVSAVINIAKNDFGFHKIYARVLASNEPAIGLFSKLDFIVEGTLVDDRLFNGVWTKNLILSKFLW
jgi:RimJ/RimL family protein N-acetyltransferase